MAQEQQRGTDVVVTGRIVWGDVKPRNKKVYGTQHNAINPKTNEPIIEYTFGLAVPKASPHSPANEQQNAQSMWAAVHAEAGKLGVQQGNTKFHWKYVDGDGRKPDGSEYPSYYKGCIVYAMSTRIPLRLSAWEGNDLKQVTPDQIKCGDYVQVAVNVAAHGDPNAGMYLNPSFVARYAHGEAIVNVPDPKTVFGSAPPPMPVGGYAQPQAPAMGGGMMQQPPQPMQMQQQPPANYAPNHQVLPPNMQPMQPMQGYAQPEQQQMPQQGMPPMTGMPPWGQPQ